MEGKFLKLSDCPHCKISFQISHGLSHHLYTNTYTDVEVSSVEPLLQYLPIPKGRLRKLSQHFVSHLFALGSYPAAFILRHYLIIFKDDDLLAEHLLPWIQLAALTVSTQVSIISILSLRQGFNRKKVQKVGHMANWPYPSPPIGILGHNKFRTL